MNSEDILENIYQFIKHHQACEEENTIIPNVIDKQMLYRCLSCDASIRVVATEEEEGDTN